MMYPLVSRVGFLKETAKRHPTQCACAFLNFDDVNQAHHAHQGVEDVDPHKISNLVFACYQRVIGEGDICQYPARPRQHALPVARATWFTKFCNGGQIGKKTSHIEQTKRQINLRFKRCVAYGANTCVRDATAKKK